MRGLPGVYFALVAVLLAEFAITLLPGDPYLTSAWGVGLAVTVLLIVLLARRSRAAWWLCALGFGFGAVRAVSSLFTEGLGTVGTVVWVALTVAAFALVVHPAMRAHVDARRPSPCASRRP